MTGFSIGDFARLRNWRHYFTNKEAGLEGWLDYKILDKKQVGVFVFLGTEPIDGSAPIDFVERMSLMGWVPKGPEKT